MNKTIIININGIIFHIEEEAYEVLQQYMIEVKRHFAYTPDHQEIVSDIENRIAEMFSERITTNKAVINMQDVEEVCSQMGSVNDFEEDTESTSQGTHSAENKSLFRDPDDKWLGGVCAGLGHYLGIESLWVRFGFLALFLFAGTGLLVYILLWALVPLARTRADKMQMRGEQQNLHNFKRNFDEEMEGIRRNFTVAGEKVGPSLKKAAKRTEDIISTTAKIIIQIVGIVLIISCGLAIVGAVITTLVLLGFLGPSSWQNMEIAHFLEPQYYGPTIIASLVLVVIPLLLLIILSLRLFMRFTFNKYMGFTMLTLWLLALFSIIYFSTTVAMDYREEATYTEKDSIGNWQAYYLDINDTRSFQKVNGRSLPFLNPRLHQSYNDIHTSIRLFPLKKGKQPYIIKKFEAHGATFNTALERAQHISYGVSVQDSSILFNSHGFIEQGLIRDQDIEVEIYLPEGAIIHINPDHRYYFRDIDFSDCFSDERPSTGLTFIMNPYGLSCID